MITLKENLKVRGYFSVTKMLYTIMYHGMCGLNCAAIKEVNFSIKTVPSFFKPANN